MNKLTTEKRCAVVRCLVDGCSIRATVRMTGVAKNTVVKLLNDLGCACAEYQDRAFRNLNCRKLQVDEIWSFCYSKEKNVPAEHKGEFGYGDVWTWTAIDAETKLVPSWLVANRDAYSAQEFIDDLASRLAGRAQLTSDGLRFYVEAVERAFGGEVDYAMLVKQYGTPPKEEARKYSPAKCIGCERHVKVGKPNPEDISTSLVERQNLTMRMGMRRFTRLTNAFSKKVENHIHAISLHFMYYNFARIHQTLKSTPAMKAGVSDHKWSIEEIVGLLETSEIPNSN